MSKRYLGRLRAEMACVEKLFIVLHPAGHAFAYRCWGDGGRCVRDAFIDGLTCAEREAGIPVYGLLFPPADVDSTPGNPLDDDAIASVWRVRNRALIGRGPIKVAIKIICADVGFGLPV
jgi:hypothetical protein